MNWRMWLILLIGTHSIRAVEPIEKLSLPLIPDLQRADLYTIKLTDHPVAVLILSPGFNGDGEDWIRDPVWQVFARQYNLGLVGLSFASDGDLLKKGRGYYYPDQGSGKLLLDGIKREFGGNLPLLLYGFSGGAHFTSGFAGWKPERILGWCAYSAEWWEKPFYNEISPPGIVACGNEDERYGASLNFFKQGRALGKPWLWVSLSKIGHLQSPQFEDFIRQYFASLLEAPKSRRAGEWVDIDFKTVAEKSTVRDQPSLTAWIPETNLLPRWLELHQP